MPTPDHTPAVPASLSQSEQTLHVIVPTSAPGVVAQFAIGTHYKVSGDKLRVGLFSSPRGLRSGLLAYVAGLIDSAYADVDGSIWVGSFSVNLQSPDDTDKVVGVFGIADYRVKAPA